MLAVAFEHARKYGRKRVTAVHKANIMKMGDGLFLRCVKKIAAEYPDIQSDDRIVDAACMARYTLVYGLRLLEEGTLVSADDAKLRLNNGETAGLTLHTIDGTIPQLRRALDRSLDAFFEFLPGATDEDKRDFDDS